MPVVATMTAGSVAESLRRGMRSPGGRRERGRNPDQHSHEHQSPDLARMRRTTVPRSAPSASRMPISFRRRATL